MSVLISEDKKELIITCNCGCGDSCHIALEGDPGDDIVSYVTYMSGNFFKEQEHSLRTKAGRIWRILRGKDYCYSDICLTRDDWCQFRDWIISQGEVSKCEEEG